MSVLWLERTALILAGCAVLFVVEWLAARTEHRRREGDDWMRVADAVQGKPERRLRAVR